MQNQTSTAAKETQKEPRRKSKDEREESRIAAMKRTGKGGSSKRKQIQGPYNPIHRCLRSKRIRQSELKVQSYIHILYLYVFLNTYALICIYISWVSRRISSSSYKAQPATMTCRIRHGARMCSPCRHWTAEARAYRLEADLRNLSILQKTFEVSDKIED